MKGNDKMDKSRHPKIQYWFWDKKTVEDENYLKHIDVIAENSDFDLIMMTERGDLNFWEAELKPLFVKTVEYAHSKGIKVGLQLWPRGFRHPTEMGWEDATALVTEYEEVFCGDRLKINAIGKSVRSKEKSVPIKSELLYAVAFKKTGDGFYQKDSLTDITALAMVKEKENSEALEISFDVEGLDGYTAYVMVAHYYTYGDMFGDFYINDYKKIMDFYKDIPFDGFGLDEFKNLQILPPWEIESFRERMYSKAFNSYFKEQTGSDLIKTMFEMRYCEDGNDEIRIRAINSYFDIFRHSTLRIEKFVADYAKKSFGEDIFIGVHDTYHNNLQNDEIWTTCCNWWEIPRRYAQTDEDITYPVRMGIACGCPENIVYDMFFHRDEEAFFKKAVRDARFNTRIHYHAINDRHWGVDTGSADFLKKIDKIERKITLLNCFDPALPKMELLAVFGFPALCNWYPDISARNKYDINDKLDIMERVDRLWKAGYLNALAPSDAVADGRITMKDGKFDYCGHKFDKLLYLYPEYSKIEVKRFITTAANDGYEIKIIGDYTHSFDGKRDSLNLDKSFFLDENSDIPREMKLTKNTIENGCILEDGSVIISDYDSVMNDSYCSYTFLLNGCKYEAEFKGTFALKTDKDSNIQKLAAGNLKFLKKDGMVVISLSGENDYIKEYQ